MKPVLLALLTVLGISGFIGPVRGGEIADACSGLSSLAVDKRLEALQVCVDRLATELEQQSEPDVSESQGIPDGAVVAFATECPASGWEDYKQGWGRFIVGAVTQEQLAEIPGAFLRDASGADITAKQLGLPGGEERHLLIESEIPSHTHAFTKAGAFHKNSGVSPLHLSWGSDAGIGGEEAPTSSYGGGQPHNNLPPYVALYLCKKVPALSP